MSETLIYTVPGMTCEHCRRSVMSEVTAVPGVSSVDVDLSTKKVTVVGDGLRDDLVRAAVVEAGYEAL